MAAIVVSNTTQADDGIPETPVKPDGSPYRFEMLFNALVDRAYADSPAELLECMIPRYTRMTEAERLAARMKHASRTQTTVQADINWAHDNLAGCTPEEQVILLSSRSLPPDIAEWSCEVPIVLIDVFYAPHGALPAPVSTLADVTNPPNILWLRPSGEHEYLFSLADVALIELNQHADFAA